jgi:hypothetical protein
LTTSLVPVVLVALVPRETSVLVIPRAAKSTQHKRAAV